MSKVKALSFVEDNEVDEAKALIDKLFIEITGKPFNYRPTGYWIACKIYVRPDKQGSIITAEVTKTQDELKSVSALVCAIGDDAFQGENLNGTTRFPNGPWCRVGDWITIPRHSSNIVKYRGVAMALIADDKIMGIVEDPADITEYYAGNKV